MLDVLAGTDRYRDPAPPEKPLRIAVSWKHPTFGARVAREIKANLDEVAGLLAEAGHEITRTDLPPYPFDLRAQVRFS